MVYTDILKASNSVELSNNLCLFCVAFAVLRSWVTLGLCHEGRPLEVGMTTRVRIREMGTAKIGHETIGSMAVMTMAVTVTGMAAPRIQGACWIMELQS